MVLILVCMWCCFGIVVMLCSWLRRWLRLFGGFVIWLDVFLWIMMCFVCVDCLLRVILLWLCCIMYNVSLCLMCFLRWVFLMFLWVWLIIFRVKRLLF